MTCTLVVARVSDRNTFKVSEYGREAAIKGFRETLLKDRELYHSLWTLSGRRLICHCRSHESCHGDVLIEEFVKSYPDAYDRSADGIVPPSPEILTFMSSEAPGGSRWR